MEIYGITLRTLWSEKDVLRREYGNRGSLSLVIHGGGIVI